VPDDVSRVAAATIAVPANRPMCDADRVRRWVSSGLGGTVRDETVRAQVLRTGLGVQQKRTVFETRRTPNNARLHPGKR